MPPWTELTGYGGSILVAVSLMMSSLVKLPSYRDLRCARFFMDEMAPIWRERGMKKMLSPAPGAVLVRAEAGLTVPEELSYQ